MTILLLTLLLLIALTVTGVGVFLSCKPGEVQRAFSLSLQQAKNWYISIKGYIDGVQRSSNWARMKKALLDVRSSGNWSRVKALLDVRSLFNARSREQMPWLGIAFIPLSLLLISYIVMQPVMSKTAVTPPKAGSLSVLPPQQANTTDIPEVKVPEVKAPEAKVEKAKAAEAVKRISQVVPDQYNSYEDFQTWFPSACSAASMTVVMNAYGKDFRIADVLQKEIEVNAISSDLGLLEPAGIDRTVEEYGFKTRWLERGNADQVVEAANEGTPVIVNFGPQPDWPGGHILVVTGSDENNVYLADSSEYDIQAMSYDDFSRQLTSFAVVVTPE